MLQKIWSDGYDWDDRLSDDLSSEVQSWLNGFSELNGVKVSRRLHFSGDQQLSSLHTFVDASEEAYAAVVFVRHETAECVTLHFVSGKTRVAPIKSLSIPRLELMAAILGLRLTAVVTRTLNLSMGDVTYWSDSQNVLSWVQSQSRSYKPFVAN